MAKSKGANTTEVPKPVATKLTDGAAVTLQRRTSGLTFGARRQLLKEINRSLGVRPGKKANQALRRLREKSLWYLAEREQWSDAPTPAEARPWLKDVLYHSKALLRCINTPSNVAVSGKAMMQLELPALLVDAARDLERLQVSLHLLSSAAEHALSRMPDSKSGRPGNEPFDGFIRGLGEIYLDIKREPPRVNANTSKDGADYFGGFWQFASAVFELLEEPLDNRTEDAFAKAINRALTS